MAASDGIPGYYCRDLNRTGSALAGYLAKGSLHIGFHNSEWLVGIFDAKIDSLVGNPQFLLLGSVLLILTKYLLS